MKVVGFTNKGAEDCQHEWVYHSADRFSFTYPPVIAQKRICEHCGREELVTGDNQVPSDDEMFTLLHNKYSK